MTDLTIFPSTQPLNQKQFTYLNNFKQKNKITK